jgi:hypothetical protein
MVFSVHSTTEATIDDIEITFITKRGEEPLIGQVMLELFLNQLELVTRNSS